MILNQTKNITGKFQNISCYCLTEKAAEKIEELLSFQNISCYCLTKKKGYNDYAII